MNTHIATVHNGQKKFQCLHCEKAFILRVNLSHHASVKHETIKKPTYNCDQRRSSFTLKGSLQRHSLRHTKIKQFKCFVCSKKFYFEYERKRHLITHTFLQARKRIQCDLCERTFSTKPGLKFHLKRNHSSYEKVSCVFCTKTYSTKNNLLFHIRSHIGEKTEVCEICSKEFCSKTEKNLHVRIHLGEKPHRCNVCAKPFTSTSNLRQHKLIHLAKVSMPYSCIFCGKRFIQLSRLCDRIVRKIGEKAFACGICSIEFSSKNSFQQHHLVHQPGKYN